jgi:hypothetical protein
MAGKIILIASAMAATFMAVCVLSVSAAADCDGVI